MDFKNSKKFFLIVTIVVFGTFLRIFLNEKVKIPNFEVMTAISLLSGSFFGGTIAMLIPVLIMFLSDLYFGNTIIYFFTWSAFILITIFGNFIKRDSKNFLIKITGAGIFSVLFFYLWTNFGWWLTFGMYPMSFPGLIQCYLAGLPFLKNQLISAIIFAPGLAIIFSLLFKFFRITREERAGNKDGLVSASLLKKLFR